MTILAYILFFSGLVELLLLDFLSWINVTGDGKKVRIVMPFLFFVAAAVCKYLS